MNGTSISATPTADVTFGVPTSALRWAVIGGVATGAVYLLSPLTVILALGLVPLLRWAVRDVHGLERRAVLVALSAAVAVRVLAIVALCVTADRDSGSFAKFFGDEEFYLLRGFRLYSMWMGIPISTESFLYAYDKTGYTSYQDILIFLQILIGPTPYSIHLLNAMMFLCCAVLLYRVVRPSFGAPAAVLGLAYLLFLPSLLMWSVSALRESLYLLCTSVALANALAIARVRRPIRRAAALVLLLALGTWLETLRAGSRVITLGGATLGYVARVALARRWLIGAFCAVVLMAMVAVWQRGLPARVQTQLQVSARYHRGHVFTPGHAFKLLDQRFYSSAWTPLLFPTMTPAETARYVTRAVVHFFAEPVPWRIASRLELAYVPELVVWYISVLLVPFGLAAGVRRDPLLTCLLASYAFLTAGIVALNSGNVGTLVRHRALIAPYVGWICALGLVSLLAAVRRPERAFQS